VVSDAVRLTQPYQGPSVFIAGADSPFRIDQDEALIQDWFPAMRMVSIPAAGHLVHMEQPDAFVREVKRFLEEVYDSSQLSSR